MDQGAKDKGAFSVPPRLHVSRNGKCWIESAVGEKMRYGNCAFRTAVGKLAPRCGWSIPEQIALCQLQPFDRLEVLLVQSKQRNIMRHGCSGDQVIGEVDVMLRGDVFEDLAEPLAHLHGEG